MERATHATDGHLIGGQGAGLVRADDGGAAESLDGRQRSDDGVLLGHTTCAECQTGGDDSRQTLGNGSHSYVSTVVSRDSVIIKNKYEPRATAILK